jgi:hypothetical protein
LDAARACQVEACAGPLCGSPDSAMYHVECNRDMFAEQPSMPWTLALCWCEWTGIYLVGAACSRRETGSRPHRLLAPKTQSVSFCPRRSQTRNKKLAAPRLHAGLEARSPAKTNVSCVLWHPLGVLYSDYDGAMNVRGDETHIAQYYASFLHVGDVEGHHSVVASLHAIGLDACGHFTKSTR